MNKTKPIMVECINLFSCPTYFSKTEEVPKMLAKSVIPDIINKGTYPETNSGLNDAKRERP